MKKIKIPLIAAAIIMLFVFTGCDKYNRDKYAGNWDFTVERIHCKKNSLGDFLEIGRETIFYSGKITLGSSENTLILHYTERDKVDIRIDKEANMYSEVGVHFGKFSNNYLYLNLHWDNYVGFVEITDRVYDNIVGTKRGSK
ncbi:MAG: hypothetical protein FWC34_10060 [Bacteroidetes bacterium]|nr:hypothetical protein [Bacteroidota bacterium]MCL2302166.1 hypothetical protein [Lentimicrobiaceae bacterium]